MFQTYCNVRNAYLVEINSGEEDAWLHDTFLKVNTTSGNFNVKKQALQYIDVKRYALKLHDIIADE